MAVTFDKPVRTGPNTWRISWSSDQVDPTFTIYRDGVLVGTTKATSWVITVGAGETPVIEVVDDGSAATPAYPGRITLNWRAVSGAAKYRVDEYVGATWTRRAVIDEAGKGYYSWRSRWLEDETTHQVRVVAIGTDGNEGTATAFSVLMVRHPDPPAVTMSYDEGTAKVTVTAA